MIFVLIGVLVVFCIFFFFVLRSFNKNMPSYRKVAGHRGLDKAQHVSKVITRTTEDGGSVVGKVSEESKNEFEIKVHRTQQRTQRFEENKTPVSHYKSLSVKTIGGMSFVGVAEQVRRLGGDPNRFSTWEEAVAYMRTLAGVEEIPYVYNLTNKIDQRLYRKIRKLGGEPQPDWSYFEAKIYITRLEHGITSEFRPVLLERSGKDYVDWFYRKSDAWKDDARKLRSENGEVIRFEVGKKYVETEYPPLSTPRFAKCVDVSRGKVKFRFAEWLCEDDEEDKVRIEKGVEVAGVYRADYLIEERPFDEKEKLTHWKVDFSSMEKPKRAQSKSVKMV